MNCTKHTLTAVAALALTACSTGFFDWIEHADTTEAEGAVSLGRPAARPVQAEDSYYVDAAARVDRRISGASSGRAKNVILFIGDGMGISTVTAARIHAGQLRGEDGESNQLAFETLPYSAFSKTYSHDAQVSDSAATATAMVAGIKAPARTLGTRQGAAYGECGSGEGRGTDTIFEIAERAGLATGFISTARLTHATPASTFAETVNRNWENDLIVPGDTELKGCPDIARQFIDWSEGDHFEIALAGGRVHFLPATVTDPENPDRTGARGDEANLVEEWAAKSDAHITVFDADGFEAARANPDARILGLFEPSHMQYELDRDAAAEPSLAEMTRAAIERLSRDEDGYVLMVEAGRIDHAHHGVNAARALMDTLALDDAVAAAMEMTSTDDTLIIVTADHSHTMTIQGYQVRNNPILGKAGFFPGQSIRARDGKPYTTLSYANGQTACVPKDDEPCERQDLTEVDTTAPDFQQQALIPLGSESHAGEDVPVYARGPGAELVRGTIEQHEIFHIMGFATGLVERK